MVLDTFIYKTVEEEMRMIFGVFLLLCSAFVQINASLENIFCSLPSSNEVMIENVPKIFELNVPYTGKGLVFICK